MTTRPLHLVAALDGAGWHPQAWREPDARPTELTTPRYWTEVVQEAEAGLLDAVTIEDSLALQSAVLFGADDRTDQVRGRLDAVLVASRVAPVTRHIGLIPTAVVTHTEPFHLSKAIATLDYVSQGRAGVRVQVSARPQEYLHVGRRRVAEIHWADPADPRNRAVLEDLFGEAEDYVEVLRRLWDSWEDDAEIRDAATGRFVDVDKLHYIDFEGRRFSVKGPSITPRPPQGQPLVAALAHQDIPYLLAARSADLAFITPFDSDGVASILDEVGTHEADVVRGESLKVLADLVVFLDDTAAQAQDRRARLDELDGAQWSSDARIVVGTPFELADLLEDWHARGLDGFRLRPASVPHDLAQITRSLVPELQRRGLFRTVYSDESLRARFGLTRPANRFATA
jgi:alkanesulfonate monooxygenase SsuD/methylene tetrahydromethanopterin reductase-like flavin-dependent oxidoreductase (luciferase family)